VTQPEHDHLLDGVLHDGCAMCVEIRRRIALAHIEQANERRLDYFAEIARRRGRPAPSEDDLP
jgi:hypothetical protein